MLVLFISHQTNPNLYHIKEQNFSEEIKLVELLI